MDGPVERTDYMQRRKLIWKAAVSLALVCGCILGHDAWADQHAPKPTAKKSVNLAAKRIAEGKKLFKALNCESCHSIENKGGCLAPPLDCVTLRDSDEYLMLRLGKGEEEKFIKRIGHPELMPHPRFDKTQLRQIIAYLRTLPCKVPPHAANSGSH